MSSPGQRNKSPRKPSTQRRLGLLTLRSIGFINTVGIGIVLLVVSRTNTSLLTIQDGKENDLTSPRFQEQQLYLHDEIKILPLDSDWKPSDQEQHHDTKDKILEPNDDASKPRSKFRDQIRRLRDLYPNGIEKNIHHVGKDNSVSTTDKSTKITKESPIKNSMTTKQDTTSNQGTAPIQQRRTEKKPTVEEGTQISIKQPKNKKQKKKIETSSLPKTLTPEELVLAYFSKQECIGKGGRLPRRKKWLKQVVIQIGVMKGGTKAIHNYLQEHPHFVSRCTKEFAKVELQYFNHKLNQSEHEVAINRRLIQKGYADHIEETCPYAVQRLKANSKLKYLDDSPLYIQDSDKIPQLLNCAMPWSKILAILRNPTERAFSHYNFYLERDWCTEHTFDEWVDINIAYLNETGVLNAKDEYEELLAWNRHNQLEERRCYTFVSRGLYAIQVFHYMMALIAGGRSTSDMMVLHSEEMQLKGEGTERQKKYDEMLSFLGLEPYVLMHNKTVHKTVYVKEMKNETREKLDAFYKPYNHRLYDLLDWDPIWN